MSDEKLQAPIQIKLTVPLLRELIKDDDTRLIIAKGVLANFERDTAPELLKIMLAPKVRELIFQVIREQLTVTGTGELKTPADVIRRHIEEVIGDTMHQQIIMVSGEQAATIPVRYQAWLDSQIEQKCKTMVAEYVMKLTREISMRANEGLAGVEMPPESYQIGKSVIDSNLVALTQLPWLEVELARKLGFEDVVFAASLVDCPDGCGDKYCREHKAHYADCPCIGPDEEDVDFIWGVRMDSQGGVGERILMGRRREAADGAHPE